MLDKLSNTITTGISEVEVYCNLGIRILFISFAFLKQFFNCIGYRPVAFEVLVTVIDELVRI
jgi:hypothetical protein